VRTFVTVVCILGCVVFLLMSACFGTVGIVVMDPHNGNNVFGSFVFLGIAAVLLFVAFLLGREAKRRLTGNR